MSTLWQSIFIAFLGIGGTLAGGFAANYYSLEQEQAKSLREKRDQAFVDFANAIDKPRRAMDLRSQTNRSTELSAKATDLETDFEVGGGGALRRIAIFGDVRVVQAIADWSRSQRKNRGNCDAGWEEDLHSWRTMRLNVLGSKDQALPRDIGELVLPCRPIYK